MAKSIKRNFLEGLLIFGAGASVLGIINNYHINKWDLDKTYNSGGSTYESHMRPVFPFGSILYRKIYGGEDNGHTSVQKDSFLRGLFGYTEYVDKERDGKTDIVLKYGFQNHLKEKLTREKDFLGNKKNFNRGDNLFKELAEKFPTRSTIPQ